MRAQHPSRAARLGDAARRWAGPPAFSSPAPPPPVTDTTSDTQPHRGSFLSPSQQRKTAPEQLIGRPTRAPCGVCGEEAAVSGVFSESSSRPVTGYQVARAAPRQPPRVVTARWTENASSAEMVLARRMAAHLPPLTVWPPRPRPASQRGRPSRPPDPSASDLQMRFSACSPPTARGLPGDGATGQTARGRVAATAASSGPLRRRRRRVVRLTLPRLLGGGGGGGDGRLPVSPPPALSMGALAADTVFL